MSQVSFTLKCHHNEDGTINAAILVDGVPDPQFAIQNGDCQDVQDLVTRAAQRLGTPIDVDASCAECFSASPPMQP